MARTPDESNEPPRPQREVVLSWMREKGVGYKTAASHFGLSVDTVKSWDRRDRRGEVGRAPVEAPRLAPLPQLRAGRRADIIQRRLRGDSLRTIAKAIGISHPAVSYHLASEEAQRVLAEVRASVVPELVLDIQDRAPRIVATLDRIARGVEEAKSGQVQAAVAMLKFCGIEERVVNVMEGSLDITARVEQLTPDELDAELAKLERASDHPAE